MTSSRHLPLAAAVAWCVLVSEREALAYLDPGSGSMLLQILLGGLAGVAVAGRMYWQRIRARFGGRRKPDAAPPSTGPRRQT